jgi:DNA-binding winged helix-turn-helix (wHTH) protein
MSQSVRPWRTRQLLQFAEFEADLRTRELRRNGISVRLQDQPFSVLALLLEHAGSVVTREELRQHLWPSDTFVDFDNSLNTAINKIREALRDSVEHPRFLETLPRRGYRFIAPVNGASSRSIFKNGQQILGPSPRWMGAIVAALAVVAAMVEQDFQAPT